MCLPKICYLFNEIGLDLYLNGDGYSYNIRLRDHLIFHRYLWFLAGSSKVQQTFNFNMPYYLKTLFDLNSDAICKNRR